MQQLSSPPTFLSPHLNTNNATLSLSLSLSPSSSSSSFSFNHHEPPPHLLLSLSSMSPPPSLPPPPPPFSISLKSIGLGYAIAIALGFLVLFSALLLSSYLCCRTRRRMRHHLPTAAASPSSSGIIVPRIIFVAEDDESDDNNNNQNRGGSGSSPIGLDRAVINSYPKFQFHKNNLEHSSEDANNSMCSICLCDYKEGEMLRMMPDCKHYFHLCCLDAWLKLNGSCPVCRNSPLPTPISTPLAEVVPLSQYPDNRRRSTVVSSS